MKKFHLVLFMAFAAGTAACTNPGPGEMERVLKVESATDLGPLSMPATVPGRDGGWSGSFFGKSLWIFGDSFITVKGEDGLNIRSSTAAWSATGAGFTSLTEPLTAAGIPYQFIPYSDDENAANQADALNGWALWGGPAMYQSGDTGLVLYQKVRRSSDGSFQSVSVGVARVKDGATTATRDPAPLFASPEPLFGSSGTYADSTYLYAYACDVTGFLDTTCKVARALVTQGDQRSAYTFYDGSQWGADISKAAIVVHNASSGFSVSYNTWLGAYLAVHSELLGTGMKLRTAPAPEGPWSDAITVAADGVGILPNTDGKFGNYLGTQHPEQGSADQRDLVVTYSRPLAPFKGEVRAVKIRLAE